ncbi:MAG: anthranilate synthase component I family protein [Bacteroidota bacterium]
MSTTPLPRISEISRLTARLTRRESTAANTEEVNSEESFAKTARRLASDSPHVILLSGGEHSCSKRSLAALQPAVIFEAKNDSCRIHTSRGTIEFNANPFDVLDQLLESWCCDANGAVLPLIAGYVAYEAGRAIELLPERAADTLQLPDIWMCFPTVLLVQPREDTQTASYDIVWSDDIGALSPLSHETGANAASRGTIPLRDSSGPSSAPQQAVAAEAVAAEDVAAETDAATVNAGDFLERSFERESYIDAVQRVRDHIYEGDVYQVNLSQRFRFPLREDAFALWLRLFSENPAPFYAWIDAGSHQVLSTSMERFFLIDDDRIETRPIKGTRPHGADEAESLRFSEELLRSEKDDAELSMIVDLERNDLGKVCAAGSIEVRAHKQIERYANVQHLVSIVEGRLLPGIGIGDLFRALFPGGSITGCPKIRAMEIIDSIESETRHVYTGCIGYISADGCADFNIAIRTAIVCDGVCQLSVGGGIVYDSDPLEEYFETLHKGRTFFQLAGIRTELD